MSAVGLPDLVLVALDHIHPCPLQPRVNVSMDHIRRLAESMRAGRHEPLLEVEPVPLQPGHYQIVCGEQRWRAAREAGLEQILVRVHPVLAYLERLRKQYEENRLRSDLDPVEDARAVLLTKVLHDVGCAEQLLRAASIPFQPLEDKRITDRHEFECHLGGLKDLLVTHRVHLTKSDAHLVAGPLSRWSETERTLGISEAARKAKLAILRLEPDLLEEVHALPAHHGSLISRVDGRERRARLVEIAARLTHRQLCAAVQRLRRDPTLGVDDAIIGRLTASADSDPDPLAFETQVLRLNDLCRQLARTLANLRTRLSSAERAEVVRVLTGLRQVLGSFHEEP